MDEQDWLARRFEENRAQLKAVAYRMLGSASEAEDAVQESWLRLSRTDAADIQNLGGWLTTVTARVCLNMLQSRKTRREEPVGAELPDPVVAGQGNGNGVDPEGEAVLADSVGAALLVVLETLSPAERLAFVLHDLFAVSFDEIAPIVGRSATAVRQLASRARRRVHGAASPDADLARQRAVVNAFLAASRNGDFAALLEMLDPDVVLRADDAAVRAASAGLAAGAPDLAPEVRGAPTVVERLGGRARGVRTAVVDGLPAAVWAPGGKPRSVLSFTVLDEKIVAIEVVADPETIAEMDLALD